MVKKLVFRSLSALAWPLAFASSANAQTSSAGPNVGRHAQDAETEADSDTFGDIVVTATRREAGAQSVPLALTAIGGDQLRAAGVTNATEIGQLAPGLVVSAALSAGSPRYSLRGLSNNDLLATAAAAVTTYIDDVPQNALYGIGASLFDLNRVEILRGPQGTTFGKNTTGGAIAYFSHDPTAELEGYITGRLGFGDRPEQSLEGAINVPINDELAARISFKTEAQDDYRRNTGPAGGKVGGGSVFSLRGQLRWTPDDLTTVSLIGYLSRGRNDQPLGYAQIGLRPPTNLDVVSYSGNYDLFDNFDNRAVTMRIERGIGTFKLTSITHYRYSYQNQSGDVDAIDLDLFYQLRKSPAEQYGQEFRLVSDSSKAISGLLGLYYEHGSIGEDTASSTSTAYGPYPGIELGLPFVYASDPDGSLPLVAGDPVRAWDSTRRVRLRTVSDTFAIFGSVTAKLIDALSIAAGARKTIEVKDTDGFNAYHFYNTTYDFNQGNLLYPVGSPPITPEQVLSYSFHKKDEPLTWDVTLSYNPVQRVLLFGRIAKGFHSGGVNSAGSLFVWSPFLVRRSVLEPARFEGETVISYEVGLKSTLMKGLRVNANLFHYDYTDQQVSSFTNGSLQTANAASSKVDGAELEIFANPLPGLLLNGSLSYLNARYTDYVIARPGRPTEVNTGNRLNQAPEWSANWSVSYSTAVCDTHEVQISTNWSYRDRIFFEQTNNMLQSDRERLIGNVRVSLQPSDLAGFSISAYMNNVTDTRPLVYSLANAAPNYFVRYYGIGRTFGLEITHHW